MFDPSRTQEYFFSNDLQVLLERVDKCESLYKKILEKSPYGIQVIDINGKIMYVNTLQCKILGYKKGELDKKNIKDLLYNIDGERLTDYLYDLSKKKKVSSSWTGKYITKERKIKKIKLIWNCMRNENGLTIGFVSFTKGSI